jgi:hypothetical protein
VKYYETVGLPESARLRKENEKADPAKDMAEARTANADVNRVRERMRVPEFLVVMRHDVTPEQVAGVIEAARAGGGKVVQRYPPRILIVQHREDIAARLRAAAGVSSVYSSPERLRLDRAGLRALRAWVLRHTPEYRAIKASGRTQRGLKLPEGGCQR